MPLKFIWQLESLNVTPLWKSWLQACTSHTLHTLHFAWHLFLFRIMTFITKNRNLFCVNETVISFCLKTLQTPAEEIRVDMLVNLCAIATCISQSNLWPLNWVKLQFQLCLVQRSNVWSGKLISRVGGAWGQGVGLTSATNNYILAHFQKIKVVLVGDQSDY